MVMGLLAVLLSARTRSPFRQLIVLRSSELSRQMFSSGRGRDGDVVGCHSCGKGCKESRRDKIHYIV